jgi:hypothetical protein
MSKIYKIIVFLICISLLLLSCSKKESPWPDRARQIVEKSYYVYEPNPLYKDEAQKINDLFHYALANRNNLDAQEQKKIHREAMAQCGENEEPGLGADDEQAIEDSVDERRDLIKYSVCMSTAALVSEPNEALLDFRKARSILTNGTNGKAHELLEEEYSATVMLEVLYLRDHNILKGENKQSAVNAINKFSNLSLASRKTIIEVIDNL